MGSWEKVQPRKWQAESVEMGKSNLPLPEVAILQAWLQMIKNSNGLWFIDNNEFREIFKSCIEKYKIKHSELSNRSLIREISFAQGICTKSSHLSHATIQRSLYMSNFIDYFYLSNEEKFILLQAVKIIIDEKTEVNNVG